MSEQIEMAGIIKLCDCLVRSGYLRPDIKDNDKTPSWDGSVWLYNKNNPKRKKIDFEERIPVQVKSESNTDIAHEQIMHNVKKSDLKNYLNDGGIIFFVIRISDFDNYRIYYETLIPLKIKRYIKSMKKKKSISINLKTFPKDNIDEFTDIFFNFANDMKKQPSDKFLSLNEFNKLHPDGFDSLAIHYRGIQYKHPMDYFLNNEVTVYAKHSGADVLIPVDFIKLNNFGQHINSPVLIENVEYYQNFNLQHSKEGIKLILGNSVSFLYFQDKEKANFNISIQGTLSQRIKDTKFILALLEYKYFSIGGEKPHDFSIGAVEENIDYSEKIDYYEKYLKYLLEINKVMEILKVNDDIILDNITEKDKEYINILISSIIYDNPQDFTVSHKKNKKTSIGAFRKNIQISNILVSILFIKKSDGKYSLSNFFVDGYTATFQMSLKDDPFDASIFLTLKKNDFLTVSNIDYDIIYKSFLNLNAKKELFEMTNQFILNMIDAYDQTKKIILLETSLKILDWVINNDCFTNHEVTLLNRIQIIKRIRTLSDDELSQLNTIITTSKNENNLTGAYLLLGDIDMANYHFKKLPKTEQEDFKKYPIYIFWKND
jgi:hypothetical protein